MEFVITKNNFANLNCFFTRTGLENISRPQISYLKIDSASNLQPIYHIGFRQNMGFIDSIKLNAGVFIFEVLDGYPLKDLLFKHNNVNKDYQFRLEDLEPMDFYCVQENNLDPYGDFILKNLKFTGTKMEQSVDNYGRRIIGEFICEEMTPFRIPYFFNHFVSDDYDQHIVRDKREIDLIEEDIKSFVDHIDNKFMMNCLFQLGTSEFKYINKEDPAGTIIFYLRRTFDKLVLYYSLKKMVNQQSPIISLQKFIRYFYKKKNEIGFEEIKHIKTLKLTNIKRLAGDIDG